MIDFLCQYNGTSIDTMGLPIFFLENRLGQARHWIRYYRHPESRYLHRGCNIAESGLESAPPGVATLKPMANGLQVSTSGASATSLTYDLNGNMTSDGTNSYSWDAENRMIKITYPGTGNYSAFSYDGLGRNVDIVETTSGSVTSTKQFVWCEDSKRPYQACEERNISGAVTKQFFANGQTISGANISTQKIGWAQFER